MTRKDWRKAIVWVLSGIAVAIAIMTLVEMNVAELEAPDAKV